MAKTGLMCHLTTAQEELYSGIVHSIILPGQEGELGVFPGHSPLLTRLLPGVVRLTPQSESEQVLYISGGLLEVQPHVVTVLADTLIRSEELDEKAALEARRHAQAIMAHGHHDLDYAKALEQLAQAIAQLQAIQTMRRKLKP